MNLRNYFGLVAVLLICVGCPNDDDDEPDVIPVRDRGEQSIEDDEIIKEYLQTHFYNYEEFENGTATQVEIDTISGNNSDKTPIIDRPELEVITYDRFETSNTLYVLRARQGGTPGGNPEEIAANFTDSIFMDFRGVNLDDGSVFDGTANPVWLNLPATIDGFARGLEGFKGDPDGATINPDGTVSYENFGAGAVFVPSGLAYFNQPPSGIDIYGSIIFTFQTYDILITDHDGDKILSIDEDVTGNKFLFDEDDNTDGDAAFNFRDPDDDNDGVQTKLEIVTEGEGDEEVFVSFLDTDSDGTPDHLDTDDDGDGRDTINEIEINNATGVITYPDSDNDGTPDYLDADS